jgi:hypothetical protein
MRDLSHCLAALNRSQRGDLVGELVLAPGQQPDPDELNDLLQLARAEYQNQEIAVYVVAHVDGKSEPTRAETEGAKHGRHDRAEPGD